MKKIIVLNLLMFICISLLSAQKPKQTVPVKSQVPVEQKTADAVKGGADIDEKMVTHFATKYSLANRWNDPDVAKSALYDLIVFYPGSDSLIFALALSYYENQKYTSSILIGNDLLARTPKSEAVLELLGLSFEGLNISDRALQNFESLYLINNKVEILYKMTFLQYELKKYPECLINIDILLTKPEAETLKLTFKDTKGKQKEYPMKVALLNLKGLVYKDQADKINAKKYFDQAIAAAPDFAPAKDNLAALAK
ncbi:hypothetical protein BH09BAC3_BH09BAC3_22890 [soil metagenome]